MLTEYVYVAFPEFTDELKNELPQISAIKNNLIFSSIYNEKICFAADVWLNPQILHVDSITQAANFLRSLNKYWFLYPQENYRRSKLIEAQLKNPFSKPLNFPRTQQYPETGVFCLLDANTLLYSTKRWKPVPIGQVSFVEDKINPPNRAYLKLWEALTFLNKYPGRGDTVLDLGAAPGGWTYSLAALGADVIAVDKAPLSPTISKNKNIQFLQASAFSLDPKTFKKIDWLCADIACYPDRLYQLVKLWLEEGNVNHMICTLKLQGKTDFAIIRKFQEIADTRVIHLYYNKHEVTFIKTSPFCP